MVTTLRTNAKNSVWELIDYTMYISLKRSHPFWSYKRNLFIHYLLLTCTPHGTIYFIFLNPMNSSNNKLHDVIFSPSVVNSLYKSDILLITFFLKVPQKTLFLQCNKSHFIHIKMKGMSDLFMYETFHCKRYFTCSESHNKDFFLKTALSPFSRVILFS